MGWHWGVWVPGVFKLGHLQQVEPLLFWNFSNFFTFILGGQFLLPQRANNGKRELLHTSQLKETVGFPCLEHSYWTIIGQWSSIITCNFQNFPLSYWEANSYYPRGPIMGKGNSPNFEIGWDRGVLVPSPFNLDHLHPFKPLLLWKNFNFFTFILGGPILITAQG